MMATGSAVTPRLIGLATAVPPNRFSQRELLELSGYTDLRRRSFFLTSEVDYRHLYLPKEGFTPTESVDELHDRYREGSVEIGKAAVASCLEKSGVPADSIDYIVTTSCTGYICPGLDAIMIKEFGMKRRIQRANLIGMGCSSALSSLQQASNYLKAHPGHRAILLAVEICSSTYFMDDDPQTAVANAIFGDGAAAALLGTDGEGIEIVGFESQVRSEYLDFMGYTQVGGRLRIQLSKGIRDIGAGLIQEAIEALLENHGLSRQEIRFWVLHSGGRKVIDRARELMDLPEEAIAPTRKILRSYGNMSSATVLFVLRETIESLHPGRGDLGVMVALGPGFATECALLRW